MTSLIAADYRQGRLGTLAFRLDGNVFGQGPCSLPISAARRRCSMLDDTARRDLALTPQNVVSLISDDEDDVGPPPSRSQSVGGDEWTLVQNVRRMLPRNRLTHAEEARQAAGRADQGGPGAYSDRPGVTDTCSPRSNSSARTTSASTPAVARCAARSLDLADALSPTSLPTRTPPSRALRRSCRRCRRRRDRSRQRSVALASLQLTHADRVGAQDAQTVGQEAGQHDLQGRRPRPRLRQRHGQQEQAARQAADQGDRRRAGQAGRLDVSLALALIGQARAMQNVRRWRWRVRPRRSLVARLGQGAPDVVGSSDTRRPPLRPTRSWSTCVLRSGASDIELTCQVGCDPARAQGASASSLRLPVVRDGPGRASPSLVTILTRAGSRRAGSGVRAQSP